MDKLGAVPSNEIGPFEGFNATIGTSSRPVNGRLLAYRANIPRQSLMSEY